MVGLLVGVVGATDAPVGLLVGARDGRDDGDVVVTGLDVGSTLARTTKSMCDPFVTNTSMGEDVDAIGAALVRSAPEAGDHNCETWNEALPTRNESTTSGIDDVSGEPNMRENMADTDTTPVLGAVHLVTATAVPSTLACMEMRPGATPDTLKVQLLRHTLACVRNGASPYTARVQPSGSRTGAGNDTPFVHVDVRGSASSNDVDAYP